MPIIKKTDVAPSRPVIIAIYGTPGSGKTSLGTTAELPLLIDTDRGYDRAVQRIDTIVAQRWKDIADEVESITGYKTVVIDTAKAMLDDYLSDYVCEQNYKLRSNTLKRFGQMGDEFKAFVNKLRNSGVDIVFICHDKESTEGDTVKHSPDCTGQSKDLLLRIADQVGYLRKVNNQRVISFEPTDNYVGKNVAQLPPIVIPDAQSPEFKTCLADIITKVKEAIASKSEEQRQAYLCLEKLRSQAASVVGLEDIDPILDGLKELPKVMKIPFFAELKETLADKGFRYDAPTKKFVADEQTDSPGNAD